MNATQMRAAYAAMQIGDVVRFDGVDPRRAAAAAHYHCRKNICDLQVRTVPGGAEVTRLA